MIDFHQLLKRVLADDPEGGLAWYLQFFRGELKYMWVEKLNMGNSITARTLGPLPNRRLSAAAQNRVS
jgi:hypothetical protein